MSHHINYFESFLSTLTLFCICYLLSAQNTKLVVNEICPSNIDQWVDPSYNYGGWIEMYNPTNSSIQMKNWRFSDDPQHLKKACLRGTVTVPAKGFAKVWFGHYDPKYGSTMVDMVLDCDGGTLYISDNNGKLLLSADYPEAISRCSWGRMPDGSDSWGYLAVPSPGKPNMGEFCYDRISPPEIQESSSIGLSKQTFHVSIPDGCLLRYTTDGSTPTLQNGADSNDGIFMPSESTTYRFRLFAEGYLPSAVVARSFIQNDQIISLPILSISSTDDNFYGDTMGFFTQGTNGRSGRGQKEKCNWNMDWERPVFFEYFTPEGELLFSQEVGVTRCGGWSRAFTPYSFKIKANKKYEGIKNLPFSFFKEKPYIKIKSLQIRNGGNDNICRIKDVALQQIVATSGMDIDYQAYQPVAHFVNGRYKGTINMRESNNKDYVYSNYGYGEEEIDLFEMSSDSAYLQNCGTNEAFKQLVSLSKQCEDDNIYQQVKNLLDIDAFCNYVAVELYLGVWDWPQNNIKGFRPRIENGKFRFVLFDLDSAFEQASNTFTTFEKKQIKNFDWLYDSTIDRYWQVEIEFVTIFLNLLKNDSFRKQFIDTYCLVAGSVFAPTRCAKIVREMANRVAATQETFANNEEADSPWKTANILIENLSADRQDTLVQALKDYPLMKLKNSSSQKVSLSTNLKEARILINGLPVPTNQFDGELFAPISLVASAPMGYHFVGWKNDAEDPHIINSEPKYELPTSGSHKLVACFELNLPNLTDSIPPIVINEISAGNGRYVNDYYKKSDWIELYNNTNIDIDLEGMYLTDKLESPHKWQICASGNDNRTIVPAHGYKIIWCDKLDSKEELHAPFALDNKDVHHIMIMAEDDSWRNIMQYSKHESTQTIGRYPDGGDNVYLLSTPTIGYTNQICTGSLDIEQPSSIYKLPMDLTNESWYLYDLCGNQVYRGAGAFCIHGLADGIYILRERNVARKIIINNPH